MPPDQDDIVEGYIRYLLCLETDDGFEHYTVKLCSGIGAASITGAIVTLCYILKFSHYVFGQEPTAADVESINFDVSILSFTVNIVVASSKINIFIGTESIQK